MVVTCPGCQKKYRLEDRHFGGKDRFQFNCPNCGRAVEVMREEAPPAEGQAQAPPSSTQKVKRVDSTWNESGVVDAELLGLPEGKRASVAVLQGPDSGAIFPVAKPLVVIGRAEADVRLTDSEVSRRHAQVEFKGGTVVLRDLKSTNGTYVNEQRITVTALEHQTEFRVGSTTLMLILTEDIP